MGIEIAIDGGYKKLLSEPRDLSILEVVREEIKQAMRVIKEIARVDPQVLGNELYYFQIE